MEKKIGIRYYKGEPLVYTNANNDVYKLGEYIIGKSEFGEAIGKIVSVTDTTESVKGSLGIIRHAKEEDLQKQREIEQKAINAQKECKEIVKKYKLDMKITNVKYTFDMSKMVIYFVSEQRVDFRELIKELVSKYKTRIELKQIGSRDEAKMCANIGLCGRETCCHAHLKEFDSVTIKNAKDQGLQINMSKISGNCGRLMCCLKYEEDAYKEMIQTMPKYNQTVKYKNQKAKVINMEILKRRVKLKIGEDGDERYETVNLDEIEKIDVQNENGGEKNEI